VVSTPYSSGVAEEFRRICKRYNTRTFFKTNCTLGNCLGKTKSKFDPCVCGRSYIGETGRPLAVRLKERKYNLKEGLCDKAQFAAHASEEGPSIAWDQIEILQI
jgi:hypothetical protein